MGGGGANATIATDRFFTSVEESRARRAQPEIKLPVYSLGTISRRKVTQKGERLARIGI